MKPSLFLLLIALLSLSISCSSTDKKTSQSSFASIQKAITAPQINGQSNDEIWNKAEWHLLNHTWVGEIPTNEDFNGRFKLLWDENMIYVLAEIGDDILMDAHEDGLDHYWDDDCLELFIDEDNSDGNHQYNHNAFAYHIATNLRVTDLGTDSLPTYFDNHVQVARTTKNNKSIWEVGMKIYKDNYVMGAKARTLAAGENVGFMLAYCDNDTSAEREHFVGSIAIEGKDKNRGWIDAGVFNNWTLVE